MKKIILPCIAIILLLSTQACKEDTVQKWKSKLSIKNLFKKAKGQTALDASDTTNMLDSDSYDPSKVDSNDIMNTIETLYESDSSMIEKIGADKSNSLTKPIDSLTNDTTLITNNKFTNDIKQINTTEITALKYNLEQLKTKIKPVPLDSNATQKQCKVWLDVSKNTQRLYLYIEGELVDTFKVSTGGKGHETPNINRRPSGPAFTKYTSKKYPGGNYNGLGNMPYVVFIQGGYAVHGTTLGNIPKLGKKASHGCVRVHPDNAKIIQELIKAAGIENSWVTIRD
jgi:lipoprotein-anchoring transpeptidase ErfK/SrfK